MTKIAPEPSDTQPSTGNAKPKTNRLDQLRKMLKRKSGATLTQMQTAFGWQPHTARTAMSGLRKGGETIDRCDGPKGSVYRIVPAKCAL